MSGVPAGGEHPSALTARALVRALAAQGVRDVVLCPGSRSAPLAYALLAADDAGLLRLHVRVDERAAGFLALGLARAGEDADRPVAVVTTSGTAAANLHPAVLEAAHAGRPLVVVTADRPHEMRGVGANQTAHQVGLFGGAVRWAADLPARETPVDPGGERALGALVARAVAAACGVRSGDPGPVHLDVGLRDPLAPAAPWVSDLRPAPLPVVLPSQPTLGAAAPALLGRGPRTVVIAGDGAGAQARDLAERAGWPLLAEPSSGARSGPAALGPYRLLLDVPDLADAVERVVLFGHPTLSRPVSRLLARLDVEVVVVAPGAGTWPDVAGAAALVCGAVDLAGPGHPAEPGRGWLDRWRRADAAARGVLDAHLARGPLAGPAIARAVATATHEGLGGARTLVVGASNAIRDLDLVDSPPAHGAGRVLANRGLAGIDGTIATAAGVALGSGAPVRALVGDLTFQHDVGALACGPLEREPDLQVVVVNDDGGAIFATLEHGAPERAAAFERIFGTPQGLGVAALCAGFGVAHTTVEDLAGLHAALARPVRGRSVIEARVDRSDVRGRAERLRADVRAEVAATASVGP